MTDTTKAQILDLARKAINTELLALKRMRSEEHTSELQSQR